MESKYKKEKRDDEERRENKYKRPRTRSRSRDRSGRKDRDSRRKRERTKSPAAETKRGKSEEITKMSVEPKKDFPQRKSKDTDMLNTRTGGAYIPPARLKMMQAQITDKSSSAYQRLAWEALKKSIHGHINKINVGNCGIIIKLILKENIVRGRGLLCRSVIQAQGASPTFTNVYAALVAAINSRFPNIGELLLKRLVIQFKRGFKRNDKSICIAAASFIAHLVNQRVAHEILALELLTLLVESPSDDSVEVAIAFLKECGQKLTEVSSKGVNAIFEMLRNILHEGHLDKRVQYMIEVMFQVWKDGFKDHPALIEELELVPEEEQFTHLLMLDEATDAQDILNVFKVDDKFEENELKYKTLCKEILGSDIDSDAEDNGSGSESGSEETDEEEEPEESKGVTIIDNTETNLVALRRTIYLTINSSLDFEECAHKLLKMQLKPGQEIELCHMFLDCCAEQRTYEKFYGLLAQRFCNINRIYVGPFEEIFKDSYSTAHRLDTNRLRNVSKFFAHLLYTDAISWEVMECVKLNEEDTTSSSRIYIKILFQELAEFMGMKKLNDRLQDPTLQESFNGVFPRDNPRNTRFSINFFTSIGLGGLTNELREHLKQMPKNMPPPVTEINVGGDSSSSDSSSSSSSDSDSSESESSEEDKNKKNKDDPKKIKKKDRKEKSPEQATNKENERWGHDGFYDTYGADARRHEHEPTGRDERVRDRNQRSNRQEKDKRDQDKSRLVERSKRLQRDRNNDSRSHEDDFEKDRHEEKRKNNRHEENRRNDRHEENRRYERHEESKRIDRHEDSKRIDRHDENKRNNRNEESKKYDRHEEKRRNNRYEENKRNNKYEENNRDPVKYENEDNERDYKHSNRRETKDRDSENKKDKKKKSSEIKDDGWDIRRGESVRREFDRYWSVKTEKDKETDYEEESSDSDSKSHRKRVK